MKSHLPTGKPQTINIGRWVVAMTAYRPPRMKNHALGNPKSGGERLMLAVTAIVSRIKPMEERRKLIFARVLAALEESKRQEGVQLIRRYRHLIDEPIE